MTIEHQYTEDKLEKINKNIKEKLDDELANVFFEREASKLNWKMSQEREAGLYVLDSCCQKIAHILKVFLLGELAIIPDGSLSSVYKKLKSHVKCILNHNKYIKEIDSYSELVKLFSELPPALSDSTLRYADWEAALKSGCRLEDYATEAAHSYGVYSYTYSHTDPFLSLLHNSDRVIERHYELRTRNSDQEIVKQIDGKNIFFKDVNSLFRKENKQNGVNYNNQFISLQQQNNYTKTQADINVDLSTSSVQNCNADNDNVNTNKKNVDFTSDGDLIVNGDRIISLKPNTKYFFFLQILFINYGTAVSHEDLFKYVTDKLAESTGAQCYPYEKSNDDFSHNCVSDIRKKIKSSKKAKNNSKLLVFNKVVVPHSTQKGAPGYRMINYQE